MSISYVTGAQATGTSAGNVSCAVGDLILVFAYRDGSNTVPTLATGFTNLGNAGANTNSERTGWKIATSTTESTGTWANATKVVALVYRTSGYATGYSLTVGATAAGTAASTTVNYPALTLQDASGTSQVAGFAGHRSVDTNVQNAPAGMTNRQATNATTAEASGHDTNAGVTSWSSTNVSVGGTSSGWRSRVVEIREVPPPPAGWTVLTQGGSTTNGTSFNTASVSPTAGARVLIGITGMGFDTTDRRVPASVGSFTLVDSEIVGPYTIGSVWEYQSATPFSGAITIDFGSNTQDVVSWIVIEREDADTVGTVAKAAATSANPAPGTIAFAGSGAETVVFNFWGDPGSATVATHTADADFYEFAEQANADSGWYSGVAVQVAADQQATCVSTLSASETWASIGFEVVLASAGVTGTSITTQGGNTASATGQVAIQAVGATTQGAHSVSSAGQIALQAEGATTQGGNIVSAAGQLAVQAVSSTTQGDTSATAEGVSASPITGEESTAQGANTTSASGALAVQAVASSAQAGNTVSATAQVELQGVVLTSQEGNTLSASGVLTVSGVLEVVQGSNSLVAEGQLPLVGVAGIAQAGNALSASGALASGNTGVLSTDQGANAVASEGVVALQAAASVEQGGHTLQATGAAPIIGVLAVSLSDTTVTASGQIVVTGVVGVAQDAPTLTAVGMGAAGSGVYPDPPQVLLGVVYGPTGTEYVGTAKMGGGAGLMRRR